MDDTGPSSMQHIDGINLAIQENTSALQPAAISALQVAQQHRQRHQQHSQEHVRQLQAQSAQRAFDQHPSNLRFQLSIQQQQQRPQQQQQHGVPQQGAAALQQLLDQQHAASQEHHRDGEKKQTLLLQRQQQQQQQLMRAQWKALPHGQQAQHHQHQQQQPHQAPALPSPLQHSSRPSSTSGSGRNTPNYCLDGDYAKVAGATENPPSSSPPPPPSSPTQPPYVFTSQQLESLKGQIATYRQMVTRMDQAKAERSVFVAKSQAQQQEQQQEIKIPPAPAPSIPAHEPTSVTSGGAVLPPIVAPKLPGSSYPIPSPSNASAGGSSVGGSPSLPWQSGGALRDGALPSGTSKASATAVPSVPSLISRAIDDKSKNNGGGSSSSNNSSGSGVNDAPLPPLSSITGEASALSAISTTDSTIPAGQSRSAALLMDRRRVGGGGGFYNDGGGGSGSGRSSEMMAEAAPKADAREKPLMASLPGCGPSAAATEGVGGTESGRLPVETGERKKLEEEEEEDEEEFVPTPVLRWRQANRAAAEGEDGATGGGEGGGMSETSSQNEYVASYGVYFPLHPMGNAAPYPLASKGVGPAIKKQPTLPWTDPSSEAYHRKGERGETLEEKEKRLLRELEKENVAEAGREEGDDNGRKRKKKERDLLAVRALRLQEACRKQVVEIAREMASRPFGGEALLDWHSFYRTKSPSLREARVLEKEKKRQAFYREEAKRRRYQHYLKTIVAHRLEFSNFHRMRRLIVSKLARACVSRTEDVAARERREEDRAERKRIQALRMNDIEAYTKLVEETKSERLKYLLGQTDQYIREIGLKIEEQREEGRAREEREAANRPSALDENDEAEEGAVASKAVKDGEGKETDSTGEVSGGGGGASLYFRKAHSKSEAVRQPSSLKGGILKEYQLQGLQWMVSLYNNNLNGILADEMGLGKTIQTIALIAYLMEVKQNHGPFLVVVPLSTLSNWVNEFSKWAPDAIVVTYKGTPTTRRDIQRQEMESGQFNVLLTTYDYVMKDKAILRKPTWQYIIVDEGHRMKNAQSKFAQTLGTMYLSRNRLLLTGTPLQNNLPELWALLNFLLPTIFNSVDTFDHWFNQPFATFKGGGAGAAAAVGGDDNGADGEQESALMSSEERMLVINRLHELLRPFMLRRVKIEVMGQLPEKVEKVLRCDLSGWQRALYKQIQESGAFGIAHDQGMSGASGKGLNNVFMQLRKVCNHPYLFFDDRWPSDMDLIRSSGKFELLDRILPKLKAGGHRILMFSQMTRAMDILEDFFTFRGYSYLRLDGATSSEEREKRMARFNAPDSPYFVFVLSTRAGGLGLNLATADTVILFDSDWNPMMDAQAQDRAHRIGQKHEVRVFRLVTDSPVEERIISRATDKLNMTGLVVEAGKFNRDSKAAERKAMLETLLREMDEEGMGEDSGETVVHDNEQINELMATTAEEMEQYQAMDQVRVAQEAEMARKKGLRRWQRLMPADEAPAWLSPGAAAAAIAKAGGRSGAAQSGQTAGVASQATQASWAGSSLGTGAARGGEAGVRGVAASRGARRKRATVDYWDGLTDRQFDSLVESGDLTEALMSDRARRAAAKTKNASSIQNHGSGGEWGGDRDGLNSAKRRKGRQQMEDEEDSSDGRGLKPEAILAMKQALKEIKKAEDPGDGRLCCELYKKLPPRREFKDYYEVIDNPIDLQIIASKVRKGKYHILKAFEADVQLLFDNAREYNLEGSEVYQDANTMQAIFSKSMAKMYAKEAEWVILDRHAEGAGVGSVTRAGGAAEKAGKGEGVDDAEEEQDSDGSDEDYTPRGASVAAAVAAAAAAAAASTVTTPRRSGEEKSGGEGQSKRGKTDKRRRVSGTPSVPSGGPGRGRPAKGGRGETPARDSAGRGFSGRGPKSKGPR